MNTLNTRILNEDGDDQLFQGQAQIFNHLFSFAQSLAIKSALELRIADIINSHGQAMSVSHIASKLEYASPDVPRLARLMQFLVWNKIFTVEYNQTSSTSKDEREALYGLTPTSRWLLHDYEFRLAPMFLTFTHPSMMAPVQEINRSINEGMASVTKTILDAILCGYKEGFSKLQGTLVDVGGGIGRAVAKIVKAHPHIKGINFDLPHVVETAPLFPNITYVGGDMFKEIPCANTVLIMVHAFF
uniref:O-methyltransferase n=1 Tax=Chenopodium quinoa TaxID=63459 RepID=A0A803LFN9_CHEQI